MSEPMQLEELDDRSITVEFTLLSGETITVRDELDDEVSEVSVRRYADALIREMGSDTVRTFSYWWNNEFYVDAIRMHEVAALSVSTVPEDEEPEDEWDA